MGLDLRHSISMGYSTARRQRVENIFAKYLHECVVTATSKSVRNRYSMIVCMVNTSSRVWINPVRFPILFVVS